MMDESLKFRAAWNVLVQYSRVSLILTLSSDKSGMLKLWNTSITAKFNETLL